MAKQFLLGTLIPNTPHWVSSTLWILLKPSDLEIHSNIKVSVYIVKFISLQRPRLFYLFVFILRLSFLDRENVGHSKYDIKLLKNIFRMAGKMAQ